MSKEKELSIKVNDGEEFNVETIMELSNGKGEDEEDE